MSRRRPRALLPEEEELWGRIARSTRPLKPVKPFARVSKLGEPAKHPATSIEPAFTAQSFTIGSRSVGTAVKNNLQPDHSHALATAPLRMDKNAFQNMKRGRILPDASIDLHGLTADRARAVLTAFLFRAQSHGKRLVLVITGKGRTIQSDGPIPTRTGVLRNSVPGWLTASPLKGIVLQVSEAHQKHGGSGAFYVYLRRPG